MGNKEIKSIDNKYRIIRKLGKGGSSTVYMVEDYNGSHLALKLLNRHSTQKKIQRLKNEFRLMCALNHKNIAKVYDFGYDPDLGNYYFTLEYIPDGNFMSFNQLYNSKEMKLESFYQLLSGLSYLHSNNFIHYDISPNNVLIKKEFDGFTVKITDFGLTTQFDAPNMNFAGTLNYMSPEMIKGIGKIDSRSDLFSAGLILANLLNDEYIYTPSSTIHEYFDKRIKFDETIVLDKLQKIKEPDFKKFLRKMLEVEPHGRYMSANEAIKAMNSIFKKDFNVIGSYETKSSFSDTTIFRENEYRTILSVFNSSKEKESQKNYIMISGESGSGKKKLVDEFKVHAQLTNHHFYKIDFLEKPDRENLEPLKNLIVSVGNIVRNGNPDTEVIDNLFYNTGSIKNKEIPGYIETTGKFIDDVSPDNILVVAMNNIEYADRNSLNFLSFVIRHLYDHINIFCIFTVNTRKITRNRKLLHDLINAPDPSRTTIFIPNLNLEQIKNIVNTYFTNLKNVPEYFYSKLQDATGNNIQRLIDILRMLYAKNIIIRTYSGYSYQTSNKFEGLLDEFIKNEIDFDPGKLSPEELSILKALSISLVKLSYEDLSEITGLSKNLVKEALDGLYEDYFIKTQGHDVLSFMITEDILKRMVISSSTADEIKYYHRKISSVVLNDIDKSDTALRIYRFIHNLAGHKNPHIDFHSKINVVKNGLLANRDIKNLIELYHTLIYKVSLGTKIKIKLLYEIIYLIFKHLVPETNQHFIEEFRTLLQRTDQAEEFSFEKDVVDIIALNFAKNFDNAKAIIGRNRDKIEDRSKRIIILDLMIYIMHQSYNHKKEFDYLDELLQYTASKQDLATIHNYLDMYDKYNRKYDENDPDQEKYENMLLGSFQTLKNSDEKEYAARAYLIMCFYYEKQRYSEKAEMFYQKAFEFMKEHRFPVFIFLARNAYSSFLENHNMFRKAVNEANKAFVFDVNYSFLFSIVSLIELRSQIRIKLEDPIQEIINDLVMLLNIETGIRSSIRRIYQNIIDLYHEAGKFNDKMEYLTSYLIAMNKDKERDEESISFYIKSLLKNYSVNEIFEYTKQYFGEMGFTEDEFLDEVYSLRERMQVASHVSRDKLSNELLIDLINNLTDSEEFDQQEIYALMDNYDSNAPIYKRTKLLLSLHNNSDYNENLDGLIQDITLLYGKGYSNTAQKYATSLAKYMFYIKQDNNAFLSFTKLSLKINGEIYVNSPQNIKSAIMKNPDIKLMKDIVHNLKKRFQA